MRTSTVITHVDMIGRMNRESPSMSIQFVCRASLPVRAHVDADSMAR